MTPKQRRFVEEYLLDLNATQAAIRAGYSDRTAYEIGRQNLKKLEVRSALEAAIPARSRRVEIDQDLVIGALVAIASIDVRELFAEDGTPRRIEDLPEDLAKAISSVEIIERRAKDGNGTERVYKIRFWSKIKALELLGRHFGLFADRVELIATASDPLLSELTESELIARLKAKRRTS